jgi:SAM-dependent methyltransferase
MVFDKQYSNFYDRFYREKDYDYECDLIEEVFRLYDTRPRSILDLGCGTGSHALILARRGYQVTGVDHSPHMLEAAGRKARAENLEITFLQQDISALTLDRETSFDAVISMFAVIGYVAENAQLEQTFANLRKHLVPGGVFLFDCWYGPAVLTQRPETRVHTYTGNQNHRLIRIVTPEPDTLKQVVAVNYRVLEIEGDRVLNETSETHRMRYFFPMEIRYFLEKAGFTYIQLYPFGDMGRKLTSGDWNMLAAAR